MQWKLKTFDELTKKELYEILRVRAKVFVVEQDCPYQDLDRKDYVSKHLFGELDDGTVIACLRILPKGVSYEDASIGRLVVDPDYRRHGYARKMLKQAIDVLTNEMGESTIRISGQAYLQKFYESLGFKTVSDTYLEDIIPHYEMLYTK